MRNQTLPILLVILTMSGCQSTLDQRSEREVQPSDNPEELLDQARLARNPLRSAELLIAASEGFLERDDPASALAILESVDVQSLDPETRDALARARAAVYERLGQIPEARSTLAQITQMTVGDLLKTANLCAQLDAHGCAADGYIQAAIKSDFDTARLPVGINDSIWAHLTRARRGPVAFTHRYHHAWWLLQQEMRNADSVSGQVTAWRRWQDEYPSHPARIAPPQALRQLDDYAIPDIGVLVPLSGPFASAGQALRDGLISAYLAERSTAKPPMRFYDSNAADLGVILEQALADDVDVFVGPLVKDNADRFARLAEAARVPTLVLNYLTNEEASHQFVYQLGIAIEDEAATLASAVLNRGHEQVLIIHSNATWSRRAVDRFTDDWRYSYATADFNDIKGLTDAVGESMQVAASHDRSTELGRILGEPLEFLPRARKDFDAVIALTTQLESRALIPALQFHFADDLPVYATSQSARGENLSELEGFTMTELPIFAEPNSKQSELLEAYDLVASPLAELYALGFDAYKVATWLPLLSATHGLSLTAATGYLDLQTSGRFRRDLSVSRVRQEGRLEPLVDF
jgi:outer membrane PBP1 activator LpoA protein